MRSREGEQLERNDSTPGRGLAGVAGNPRLCNSSARTSLLLYELRGGQAKPVFEGKGEVG